MLRRVVFVLGIVGASALGMAGSSGSSVAGSGSLPGEASTAVGCPASRAREVTLRTPETSTGEDVWAAAGGRLVRVSSSEPLVAGRSGQTGVVVRHVVGVEGVGTAFVEDGAGVDAVVLTTDTGVVRIPQRAEAVNPALSAEGDLAWSVGSQIRLRDARTERITRLPAPVKGAQVFSPVFVAGGALAVVVSSPPTGAVPEDERLNDIWRVSLEGGQWSRLTKYHAGDDRWTAIRTPVPAPEGGIEFVLVRGRGSATREPRFTLMHLGPAGVDRPQTLDREMYLAGFDGRARLWNVPDIPAARVDLVRETSGGARRTIGCGATLMDPIDVIDPDHAAGAGGSGVPARSTSVSDADGASAVAATQGATQGELGILVGDFATAAEAEVAAAAIRASYGDGWPVAVEDATTAPHAIRPGVYGVILQLVTGEDPSAALATFRAKLPAYASSSWVVSA